MGWRDNPMCGFDTETDGPNPEDAHIISACVGVAGPTGWKATTWLLKPSRPIPDEAAAIHGITTEHAMERGMERGGALADIHRHLAHAWAQGWPVVGHNASFDMTVLARELAREDLPPLTIDGPVIDTMVTDKHVDRYRRGSRKLIDVAAHYGVPLDEADAHGAEADALAACRIAWKIGAHPKLAALDLADLHDLQVEAYREQRESFAAYRARKGEPLDDVNTHWPLRPAA